jgi:hypothetical protein
MGSKSYGWVVMRRKTLFRMVLFLAIVTGVEVSVLNHYEAMLSRVTDAYDSTASPASGTTWTEMSNTIRALKSKYTRIAVSDDARYAACLDSANEIHILDLATNKELRAFKNLYPVDYLVWVRDDSVLVGEHEDGGKLLLKRLDITTGYQQSIHTFAGLPSSDDIRKITFSIETNDTYVLIGNSTSTVVYHFDTNGRINIVDLGGRYIKNIGVTQSSNCLYFEDAVPGTFNVGVVTPDGAVKILYHGWALITVAGDTAYIGALDPSGKVIGVYRDENGIPQLVKRLDSPAKAQDIHVSEDGEVTVFA